MQNLRRTIHEFRAGWLSVTVQYVALLAVVYLVYRWLSGAPGAALPPSSLTGQIFTSPARLWEGLNDVWFIFAWGFGLQGLIQILWVIRRKPKDGDWRYQVRRSWWVSAHAGIFEELIFRYFGFLSLVVALRFANDRTGGWIGQVAGGLVSPVINTITFGVFQNQFNAAHWYLGVAAIIGAAFFRSAHMHYGNFAKANVWVIGVIMFWLTFNYGLVTAICAHFLYDFAVFSAILLTSPLQPPAKTE